MNVGLDILTVKCVNKYSKKIIQFQFMHEWFIYTTWICYADTLSSRDEGAALLILPDFFGATHLCKHKD